MADLVAGAEGKRMHVAMLAMPIPGHIIPMLHLSFQLASKGVKVTFVNSEYNRSKMKLPACIDTNSENERLFNNITFLYIPDGLPPEHGRTSDLIALLMAMDACFGYHFEKLLHIQLALQQDPPITCIVSNTFISHVQETARMIGLPYVSFWTQSAASFVSVGMVAKGYRPPEDSQPSDFLTPGMLPGVPALKLGELNGFLQCYNEDDFMFRFFVAPHKRIAEADCILLNTFEELEEETMVALRKENPNALAVGPLLPGWFLDVEAEGGRGAAMASWDVADEDGQGCLRWLDKQEERSVIYVCFGSMTVMCREQIQEIAMGLEASKQAFLWVVRPALGRSKEEELPAGFVDRTAAQGLVISWAPQLSVLRHKAVAGFLTHCGWNSTLECICAGVPLLAWPSSFSDQATNRRCIVDKWHIGLSLERAAAPPGLVERGEVEKKVVELMSKGEVLRGMANQWRGAAVKAACSSSSLNLQRFIDIVSPVGGLHVAEA